MVQFMQQVLFGIFMWHVFNFLVAGELSALLIFVGMAFTCHVREVSSCKCSLIPFVDKRR